VKSRLDNDESCERWWNVASPLMTIIPDEKDWTWILERPCPECHFDVATLDLTLMPSLVLSLSHAWQQALTQPDVERRLTPKKWSTLEYACHVRDVFSLFASRLHAMIEEDGAKFLNWDQDAAATAGRYDEQLPSAVSGELGQAAALLEEQFALVEGDLWNHRGLRSNGSVFTIATFAQYFAHDPIHHLYDIGSPELARFITNDAADK